MFPTQWGKVPAVRGTRTDGKGQLTRICRSRRTGALGLAPYLEGSSLAFQGPSPSKLGDMCASFGSMDYPVTYERKVRFSDSDAQGIVFNGNYLTYFDDTITDYLEASGIGWDGMTKRGVDMVLGRAEVDFRAAGQIGDTLVTGAKVVEVGRTSVIFEMRTWDKATEQTVAEGRLIQVMVDHRSHRPTPVPDWFIAAVEKLQQAPSRRKTPNRDADNEPSGRTSSPTLDPGRLRPGG